jgi:hypothetical protein
MTTTEAIIAEIRESRVRMSEQCGHDSASLIAYLKTFNDKYAAQVARYRAERLPAPLDTARAN